MIGAPEYISLRVDISDFQKAISGGDTDDSYLKIINGLNGAADAGVENFNTSIS
jgi:hypothetical protein